MATSYAAPGVYVEEVPGGTHPITPLGISTPGFQFCFSFAAQLFLIRTFTINTLH